ncbi:MAG: hypothetical protein QG614_629 [Patescibacteria group bacterium]|nr:hypothetical protein [Patescibacteria group bacterium]
MNQIVIQKKFLFLVEVSQNVWRLFLLIVNFVFDLKEKAEDFAKEAANKVVNYVRALFGFNIYRLNTIKLNNNFSRFENNNLVFKNDNFLRYSHLLAPPYFN